MKTNIKEMSQITGFSPATISNALNHKKGVNKETAAEVIRVAKEMGYISESSITKIKLVVYKKNGLIIEDTPFFSLITDGFEKECRACGYDMMMCYLDSRSEEYEAQVNKLMHDTSAGIVLLGTELDHDDFEIFKQGKCPLITLDYWNSDMYCNSVFINNVDSARGAVDYLIQKGHREIGYLKGDFRIKAFQSRGNGYKTAMTKRELPIDSDYIVTLSTTMDGAYKDMITHLSRKPNLPTAFFSDNDMIALGAMKALQEFGYQIPEDISMIGFDDLPFCEIASPRLTSLRVPKQEMGRVAARRMAELIREGEDIKLKIQVCTEFIERDSVKDINATLQQKGIEGNAE
ncbi:MAG: LacI family DNA-binding transcriptional regulator [Lachnospiraceae bacterium]